MLHDYSRISKQNSVETYALKCCCWTDPLAFFTKLYFVTASLKPGGYKSAYVQLKELFFANIPIWHVLKTTRHRGSHGIIYKTLTVPLDIHIYKNLIKYFQLHVKKLFAGVNIKYFFFFLSLSLKYIFFYKSIVKIKSYILFKLPKSEGLFSKRILEWRFS